MKTGFSHQYHWVVSDDIDDIDTLVKAYHAKHILHLATSDSGPLKPSNKQIKLGWKEYGEIIISPPLSNDLVLPFVHYQEWYVSENLLVFPEKLDRYVNYSGFNLTPDCEFSKSLISKFWKQVAFINPETFVAMGTYDIVISKNKNLIEYISNKT